MQEDVMKSTNSWPKAKCSSSVCFIETPSAVSWAADGVFFVFVKMRDFLHETNVINYKEDNHGNNCP